jgi:hypothetical protein
MTPDDVMSSDEPVGESAAGAATRRAEVRQPGRPPMRSSSARGHASVSHPVLMPPAREVIEGLPPFDPIDLDRITVIADEVALAEAGARLEAEPWLGFDTESRPTFVRGEVSDGPHLVQFATLTHAWLLPMHVAGSLALVGRLFATEAILKVGFGLDSDRTLIARRTGRPARGVIDLDSHFRRIGYRGSLGVRSAIAVVLGQCFTKSKRVGTSNWSSPVLNEAQIRYAANDAFGAARIYDAIGRPPMDREAVERSPAARRSTERVSTERASTERASTERAPTERAPTERAAAPASSTSPGSARRLPALLRRPGS